MSCGNIRTGAGISEHLGDADKVKWRTGQYTAIHSLSLNATPEETCLALFKMEKYVFETQRSNEGPMNGREMRLKKGMDVLHQLLEIDNKYNK